MFRVFLFEKLYRLKGERRKIMMIKDVLAKLRMVKETNTGWMACCPAHNDKNPSLAISEGNNGKVLFKCFAGCSFENIAHALGLNEREQKAKSVQPKSQNEQNKIVATYDYTDENGNLIYQMVRFEPKRFSVRRPDGKGGWIWNLKDTKTYLYRLLEVLAARENDFPVILCEGEKDADNVRLNFDFLATTSPLGAKSWKDEYADYLFGLNVIILPDNDDAGREYIESVASSLNGKAQSIRVVHLPDLPVKGDVSDWIKQGGTREKLIELIDQTEEWQPNEQPENIDDFYSAEQDFFVIKTMNEWIKEAKTKPIPKMLFGEFWCEDEICILFSDTNLGKSILAVQIAESISNGKQIGIFPLGVEPQKVLYFDFELSELQQSIRYSEKKGEIYTNEYVFSKNFIRIEKNPDFNSPDVRNYEQFLADSMETAIEKTGAKVIIVDNITYLRNDNEKAKDALPLMKELKFLKQKHGLSLLVLAHTPKRDLSKPITKNDLGGSKMLMNFCDSSFTIGESFIDKNLRYLKQIKVRNTAFIYDGENVCTCQIIKPTNFLELEFLRFSVEREHLRERNEKDREQQIQQAKKLQAEGKNQRQIAETLGVSLGKVNNLLKQDIDVQTVQFFQDLNDVNILNNSDDMGVSE